MSRRRPATCAEVEEKRFWRAGTFQRSMGLNRLMRSTPLNRVTGILLFSLLLVGCLRLPCYSLALSERTDHSCCGISQPELVSKAPCCDNFIVQSMDQSLGFIPLFVVESIELPELSPSVEQVPGVVPEARPPPSQGDQTRPSSPRAPPSL